MSLANLDARRARLAHALGLTDELLLVGAGEPVPLPEGTDQTYPFRAHAEYVYLTGLDHPGGVVAFDPREGPEAGWVSFVPDVTESERVWEARVQPPGEALARLEPWLGARRGRPLVAVGAPLRGVRADEARTLRTRERFAHARRPKDAAELRLMRRAAEATAAGFAAAQDFLRPGVTERAVQIELEAAFFRAGAARTGYDTIVGAGPNASVLHFSPSSRVLRAGDFVLIDAGAEVERYVIDVTRTFVVGPPSAFQRDLFQLVLGVKDAAVARCVPGAEWRDLHLQAALELTTGLVDMGLLYGEAGQLVERGAHTLFFPHGLGHLVGLGVRDASGRLPGRGPEDAPVGLRLDLPLAVGYVVTVEPGLYMIPTLLNDPARRDRYRESVNWALVERYLEVGGVRLEDNVLVTEGVPEVLTRQVPTGW